MSNRWYTENGKGEKPSPRYGHSMILWKKYVIIYGGFNGRERLGDLFLYDLEKFEWKKMSQKVVPCHRDCHSAIMRGNGMIVFGGANNLGWLNDMHCYEPLNGTWNEINYIQNNSSTFSSPNRFPEERAGHSASLIDGKMYICAGWNGEKTLGDIWVFRFVKEYEGIWTPVNWTISPRDSHSATVNGEEIIIIGGGDGGTRVSVISHFNVQKNKWKKVKTNLNIAGHSAVQVQNSIYLFSGGKGYTFPNHLMVYNIRTGELNHLQSPPENIKSGGYGSKGIYYKGFFFFFGGGDGKRFFGDLCVWKAPSSFPSLHNNLLIELSNETLSDITVSTQLHTLNSFIGENPF